LAAAAAEVAGTQYEAAKDTFQVRTDLFLQMPKPKRIITRPHHPTVPNCSQFTTTQQTKAIDTTTTTINASELTTSSLL